MAMVTTKSVVVVGSLTNANSQAQKISAPSPINATVNSCSISDQATNVGKWSDVLFDQVIATANECKCMGFSLQQMRRQAVVYSCT